MLKDFGVGFILLVIKIILDILLNGNQNQCVFCSTLLQAFDVMYKSELSYEHCWLEIVIVKNKITEFKESHFYRWSYPRFLKLELLNSD